MGALVNYPNSITDEVMVVGWIGGEIAEKNTKHAVSRVLASLRIIPILHDVINKPSSMKDFKLVEIGLWAMKTIFVFIVISIILDVVYPILKGNSPDTVFSHLKNTFFESRKLIIYLAISLAIVRYRTRKVAQDR